MQVGDRIYFGKGLVYRDPATIPIRWRGDHNGADSAKRNWIFAEDEMNVLKIVVDGKLPKSCHVCQFKQTYEMFMPDCSITHFIIYTDDEHRPESCPLVVEVPELCEWVLTRDIESGIWDIAPGCCVGELSMNKPKYEICPSCLLPIKYIESD